MRTAVLITFLIFTFVNYAQRIINFALYSTNSSVVVKFTITPGSSCSGFTLLHSIDSLNYSEIASEPGICGASSINEEKIITDNNPVFNQINYYKIRLEPRVETSFPRTIFVTSSRGANLLVYPNPLSESNGLLNIRVLAATNSRLIATIYNYDGRPLQNLDLVTSDNHATVNVSSLSNGLYTIRMTDGSKIFTGKISILK